MLVVMGLDFDQFDSTSGFFQIPSFGGTNIMKYATYLTVICVVWRMILYFSLMGYHGKYPYTCYGGQTLTSTLTGTCNMIYTFSVTNVLPEMMREMTNPREMHRSWFISQCFAMPLFMVFGFWGFYLYGVFNQQATFSVQFPATSTALMVYNIFALVGNLLPSVYNQLAVFLKVELQLGVMPTDWWSMSFPELAILPRVPPVVFRFFFRSTVLAIYVLTAMAFLSDGIGNIQGLVGALSVAAFSFYLPWVMYWRVHRHEMRVSMKVACAFWFTLGFGAAVAGAVASGMEMMKMSGGFFTFPQSICGANSFYMGVWGGGGVKKNPLHDGAFSDRKGPGSFHDTFYAATCRADGIRIDCAQPNLHCCDWDENQQQVICLANTSTQATGNTGLVLDVHHDTAAQIQI